MLVVDSPSYKEEGADEMGHGGSADAIAEALDGIGLKLSDVYITSLIKSPKLDSKKGYENATLAECPVWLNREIEILKPPVIVILGSLTFKHFMRDAKGGINDATGRVVYDKARDCNLLVGINPGAIYFDASKQETLNQVFAKIADLLPS